MKKRLLLLLLIVVIAIAAIALYNNRDIFRQEDTISIVGTEDRVLEHLKIYAVTDQSGTAEYRNGTWYDEKGTPAKLVANGKNTFPLPKEYGHVDFYFTIGDSLYDFLTLPKEKKSMAFDYWFQFVPHDTTYVLNGAGIHYKREKVSFRNRRMQPIYSGKIKITKTEQGKMIQH